MTPPFIPFAWPVVESVLQIGTRLLLLALAIGLMLTGPCNAGWISEVSPAARDVDNSHAGLSTLPPYVELSDLSPNPAASLQLVVLNASPGAAAGLVLEAITVPAGPGLQLVTDGVWPTDAEPYPLGGADPFTPLADGQTLPIAGARSLLLFDRPTGLAAGIGAIQDNLDRIGDAVLLDAVTFGPAGGLVAYANEPVVELAGGEALARPAQQDGGPDPGVILSGQPLNDQSLPITPPYVLNPGRYNPTWQPQVNPEPGSGFIVAALGVLMGIGPLGRRGRGRRWPCARRGLSLISLRGDQPCRK
jgi:hypothetical protein